MRKRIQILLFISLSLLPLCITAKEVTIKSSMDSAYILMGKQTPLHIEILQSGDDIGYIPQLKNDTLTSAVELVGVTAADTVDLGNNRRQIRFDLVLQSFDSGLYTLPPILYTVGQDSFFTQELALKVLPVPVDTLQTVHDFADVIAPDSKFFDFLPDFVTNYWWAILIALLLVAAAIIYFKYFRKRELPQIFKKKEIPPYDLAIGRLNDLLAENLCEKGQEKVYYTRLTEILRVYLEGRFGINAMEMTSTQIMDNLKNNDDTKDSSKTMEKVLYVADFVKFAKVRPLPDDNNKAFDNAMRFVESTRPVVVAEVNEGNVKAVSEDKSIIVNQSKK